MASVTATSNVLSGTALAVLSSDSDVLDDRLDLGDSHAGLALDAAGAALGGSRGLRSRCGSGSGLVGRSFLRGCSGGNLGLGLAGSGRSDGLGLVIDNIGRGVVVNGRGGLSSRGSGGSLGLLFDGGSACRLGGSRPGLLGRLGLWGGVDVATVDAAGEDGADVDGPFLLRKDLVLVGWAVEVTGSARVVDGLALGLPKLAAGAASDGCSVEAFLSLLPTLLARGPAALLGGVVGDLLTAPVSVLDKAASGLLTLGLRSLAGGCDLDRAGGKLGDLRPRHLVGGGVLVINVEAGAGLIVVDVSRDGDSRFRHKVTVTLEEDLSTASVELRVAVLGCVKSKNFGAGKVVTSLKTGRKLDVEQTIVVDDLVRAPAVR